MSVALSAVVFFVVVLFAAGLIGLFFSWPFLLVNARRERVWSELGDNVSDGAAPKARSTTPLALRVPRRA